MSGIDWQLVHQYPLFYSQALKIQILKNEGKNKMKGKRISRRPPVRDGKVWKSCNIKCVLLEVKGMSQDDITLNKTSTHIELELRS